MKQVADIWILQFYAVATNTETTNILCCSPRGQGGSARRNAYENIAIVITDKQWFQLIFNGHVMKCAIIVMRLKNLLKSILFIGIYWLCGLKNFGDTSCSRMR